MPAADPRAVPWRCPACGTILGTIDRQAGTLYVTLDGAFVEIGRSTTVHCPHPCYATKRFHGRRVVVIAGDERKSA